MSVCVCGFGGAVCPVQTRNLMCSTCRTHETTSQKTHREVHVADGTLDARSRAEEAMLFDTAGRLNWCGVVSRGCVCGPPSTKASLRSPCVVPRVVSICEIPVAMEDRIPIIQPVRTTMGIPQTQQIEQSIDFPIEPQQQIPTAPPLQTTVEEPMVQRIDELFLIPVCTGRRVPLPQLVQTTIEVPQAQRVERSIDVPYRRDKFPQHNHFK